MPKRKRSDDIDSEAATVDWLHDILLECDSCLLDELKDVVQQFPNAIRVKNPDGWLPLHKACYHGCCSNASISAGGDKKWSSATAQSMSQEIIIDYHSIASRSLAWCRPYAKLLWLVTIAQCLLLLLYGWSYSISVSSLATASPMLGKIRWKTTTALCMPWWSIIECHSNAHTSLAQCRLYENNHRRLPLHNAWENGCTNEVILFWSDHGCNLCRLRTSGAGYLCTLHTKGNILWPSFNCSCKLGLMPSIPKITMACYRCMVLAGTYGCTNEVIQFWHIPGPGCHPYSCRQIATHCHCTMHVKGNILWQSCKCWYKLGPRMGF